LEMERKRGRCVEFQTTPHSVRRVGRHQTR
jgi:hypothetical protein